MNKLFFIGDTHGKFDRLSQQLSQHSDADRVYQVGDFGIGLRAVPDLPDNFRFIRGNHDHPHLARSHKNYLGDYGVDEFGVGYISGAYSIDKDDRIIGVSWWPGEELGYLEILEACNKLIESKPDIIITHTAPQPFISELVIRDIPSRTEQALTYLFGSFQPKVWICGHFHCSLDIEMRGTRFVCLKELEELVLEV